MTLPLVVAITGATGVIYGVEMLRVLKDLGQEAHLIALACSAPPKGKRRWTLRLLAGQMVELEHAESLSHEAVRRALKKTRSSRT